MAGNLHGHQQALTAGYVDKAIGAWGSTTLSKSITAPCAISVSRRCSQFIADMLYPCLTLSAPAVPAPRPLAMQVAIPRPEPKPGPSAPSQRPARTRLTLPRGTRQPHGTL